MQPLIIDKIHQRKKMPIRVKWDIPYDVLEYVLKGEKIRSYTTEELLDKSTFYLAKSLFGMGGITFHRRSIIIHEKIRDKVSYEQAALVYHELVHVAQQLDMSWPKFMLRYANEWVAAGFSYNTMCKLGLELEAYSAQRSFLRKIKEFIYSDGSQLPSPPFVISGKPDE